MKTKKLLIITIMALSKGGAAYAADVQLTNEVDWLGVTMGEAHLVPAIPENDMFYEHIQRANADYSYGLQTDEAEINKQLDLRKVSMIDPNTIWEPYYPSGTAESYHVLEATTWTSPSTDPNVIVGYNSTTEYWDGSELKAYRPGFPLFTERRTVKYYIGPLNEATGKRTVVGAIFSITGVSPTNLQWHYYTAAIGTIGNVSTTPEPTEQDVGEFVGGVIGYEHETLALKETGTLNVSRKRYLVDTDMAAVLQFKNTGSLTWDSSDYDLVINSNKSSKEWDSWYFDGLELPVEEVAPGENVEIHVEFETFDETSDDALSFSLVKREGESHVSLCDTPVATIRSQTPIKIEGAAGSIKRNGPIPLTMDAFQVAWNLDEGPMPRGDTVATITRNKADWDDEKVELGTKTLAEWVDEGTILSTGVYEIEYIYSPAEEEEFYASGTPRVEWTLKSGVKIAVDQTVDLEIDADQGGIDSEEQVTYFEPGAVVTFTAKAREGYSWGDSYDADPIVWTGSSSLIGRSAESEKLTVTIPNDLMEPLDLSSIAYNLQPRIEAIGTEKATPQRAWVRDGVIHAYLGRDGVVISARGRDRESTLSSLEVQYKKPDGVWKPFATSGIPDSQADRTATVTVRGMIGEVDPVKTLIPVDWETIGDKTWTFRFRLEDESGTTSNWAEIPVFVVTPLKTVEKTVRTLAPEGLEGWFNDSKPRTDTFKVWIP